MLSPVWTPIGSTFSMEQTTTTLSILSRITSSSNSFHPMTDSSIMTSRIRLASRPPAVSFSRSSRLYATPPPVPPRVKLGRTMAGYPIFSAAERAPPRSRTMALFGTRSPMRPMASRKRSLSSAFLMASTEAPTISTPYLSRTPRSATRTAVLSPVWPPSVGRSACGRSLSMIRATNSGVIGSM